MIIHEISCILSKLIGNVREPPRLMLEIVKNKMLNMLSKFS